MRRPSLPFQIDNELQAQEDFSGLTAAAFQAWLGAKYNGSLAAINAAWGTVFWSHTYNALADIPALWATLGEQHNPGMVREAYVVERGQLNPGMVREGGFRVTGG